MTSKLNEFFIKAFKNTDIDGAIIPKNEMDFVNRALEKFSKKSEKEKNEVSDTKQTSNPNKTYYDELVDIYTNPSHLIGRTFTAIFLTDPDELISQTFTSTISGIKITSNRVTIISAVSIYAETHHTSFTSTEPGKWFMKCGCYDGLVHKKKCKIVIER